MDKILTFCIAAVWMINGLFCKVLDLVPRHELIIASILGNNYSRPLTVLIGLFEILISIWVLTGIKSRLNAIVQMIIIATMNILEFILVPDLLLWGKWNSLFALFFIFLIYFKEFFLSKENVLQS